jgi:hypothetical protein
MHRVLGDSTDLIRIGVVMSSAQSLNRYAYVSDDPINKLDPDGLSCEWILAPIFDNETFGVHGYHWVMACSLVPGPRKGDLPDPAGLGPTYETPGEHGKDFWKTHKNCRKRFKDPENAWGTQDESAFATINQILKNATWVDLNIGANLHLLGETFAQAGYPTPDNFSGTGTIGEYFGGPDPQFDGNTPTAITFFQISLVLLGPLYRKHSSSDKEITVIHEALHLLFYSSSIPGSESHMNIADALGIKINGEVNDTNSSHAIDAWLRADCPENFTYTPPPH